MMTKKRIWVWALIILPLLTTSCFEESDFEKLQKKSDQQISEYLTSNSIEATLSSGGIYYEKLVENKEGQYPSHEDILIVKYELRKLDGTLLALVKEDTTFFRFGTSSIIPEGILYGMDVTRTGETTRFYLPSYLAYGIYHPEDHLFDEYENFIVEMELVKIYSEEEVNVFEIEAIENYLTENQINDMTASASGLYFKTLTSGTGETAQSFNEVSLHYTRKYLDGSIIQKTDLNSPLTVQLNSGGLVEGFGQGVLNMKAGETALLIMPSNLAFGASIQVFPETLRQELYNDGLINNLVAPYSPVIYEVELLEIN